MADYIVNYQINVESEKALMNIQKFSTAVQELSSLTSIFSSLTQQMGTFNRQLSALGKQKIEINVSTIQAERRLERVLGKVKQIQTAANITLKINGGKTSGNKRADNLNNVLQTIASTNEAVNAFNKKYIRPKVRAKKAIRTLDDIIARLDRIKTNSKLNISVGASSQTGRMNAGAANRTRTGGAAVRAVRAVPETMAGHSKYLFPSTRQVLGPTYAGTGINVVGEMVKGMGVMYGLSAVMSGITSAFTDAATYNNISQTTKNILGAHDKRGSFEREFDEMGAIMRQVGVDTRFTAPQVASAGKYLAMAGYRVDDIKKAIRPITDIALIGDTDLGDTADVVTNIMTSYKMPSEKVGNAADILTMTFTKTNTTLMELAESFKYAGTMAHQSGLSFETSTAAFGVLGDAGIKGSQAGTTLRMMLMNILNPTKKQREAWELAGIKTDDGHGNLRDFVDILTDLKQVQKQTNAYDFSKLISRMFRVTATPGAIALVNNVDKLREVTELNKTSYGLSSQLSAAKQNTIQGLWYQMTSAFTESGMQGFESMQSAIREFLQRMIAIMKSPDFAESLRSAMDMFMKIAGAMVDIFQKIVKWWNSIPQWGKDGLVYFIKLQAITHVIAGTIQSIQSTFIFIRGFLQGTVLSTPIMKMFELLAIIRHPKKFARLFKLADSLGYKRSRVINRIVNAGAATAAGGEIRSAITGGSLLKDSHILSPMKFIFTRVLPRLAAGPLAWGAVLLGGASKIRALMKEVVRATFANREWAESLQNLNLEQLDIADPDSKIIANMRLYTSNIKDQNVLLKESIKYHQLLQEAKEKANPTSDNTPLSQTKEGESWASFIDRANNPTQDITSSFESIYNALGATTETVWENGHTRKILRLGDRNFYYNRTRMGKHELDPRTAVQLSLAQYALDQNNPQLNDVIKELRTRMSGISSGEDGNVILKDIYKKYHDIPIDHRWDDGIWPEEANRMSLEQVRSSYEYQRNFKTATAKYFEAFAAYSQLVSDINNGKKVHPNTAQQALELFSDKIFNVTFGSFGTELWSTKVKETLNYGFKSTDDAVTWLHELFTSVAQWYEQLPKNIQPTFFRFLDRDVWQELYPDRPLPEGVGYSSSELIKNNQAKRQVVTYDPASFIPWRKEEKPASILGEVNELIMLNKKMSGSKDNALLENPLESLHKLNFDGNDDYQKRYSSTNTAPKQVIVRIENLMNVENVDMTDERKAAVVTNLKEEMAQALLEVVSGFSQDFHN